MKFSYNDIDGMQWFEAAMITSFPGVFDDCEDNYDVEDRLREAGVIAADNQTDTESCALVVYFKSDDEARAFCDRLKAFVESAVVRA